MKYNVIVLFALTLSVLCGKEQEVEVINSISQHIGNVVLECQDQMHFADDIIEEFLVFWNTQYVLSDINQGCVVACILKRLELVQPGGKLERSHAEAFAEANGAGVEMRNQLIELYYLCTRAAFSKNTVREQKDGCVFGLEIAKCFRYGIFRMQWAPAYVVDYPDVIKSEVNEEMPDYN